MTYTGRKIGEGLEADLGLVAFESDVGSLGFDPEKGYGEKGL